jgi:hypothetical protein
MDIKHRFDFTNVFARLSTWAGILAGAAGVSLLAYSGLPQRAQDLVPDWAVSILTALSVGVPFLMFLLTSFKQKNMGRATEVVVTQQIKVQGDITQEDATRIAEAQVTPAPELPEQAQ